MRVWEGNSFRKTGQDLHNVVVFTIQKLIELDISGGGVFQYLGGNFK